MADKYRRRLNKIQAENVPIDIKPINPPDIFTTEQQEPKQLFWVRARGYIGGHCPEGLPLLHELGLRLTLRLHSMLVTGLGGLRLLAVPQACGKPGDLGAEAPRGRA